MERRERRRRKTQRGREISTGTGFEARRSREIKEGVCYDAHACMNGQVSWANSFHA
jgi:hypothetical protein